ncbi:hypothetical protein ACIPY0_10135 [Paenarthrobacter nicotinovorans]|uniref:hypothetical protein n=1 Tax=Paenarthrobacter nicotinovorans TaxID=29320 RepID=UPI0037F90D6D
MASSNLLSHTRYRQGEWFGVIRNGTAVLLGPDTPHALLDTVWELLSSSPEAHEVLHEVTEAFGVSLSRIPPFGIIDSKDALRVFLRGDLELSVQLADRQEHLTGRDVTTWTERRIAGATALSIHIGAQATEGMERPRLDTLPVKDGVVLLASLKAGGQGIAVDGPTTTEPASEPAVAAAAPAVQAPAASVSDETMIGYHEADLGLTIAPGQAPVIDGHLGGASAPVDQPASGDESASGEPGATEISAPEDSGESFPSGVEVEQAAAESVAGESGEEPEEGPDGEPAPAESADDLVVNDHEVPVHTSTTDPLSPSLENTTNYDHLWDKTVMRNIEDAAVRLDSDADDHDAPVGHAPAPQPPSETEQPAPEPSTPAPAPPSEASHSAAPAASGGLIDSVPWLRSAPSAPPVAQPAPQVPAAWTPAPASSGSMVDEDSDHDGQTIMKSSLPRTSDTGEAGTSSDAPAVNGPSVLARVCPQGHANPPTYPLCSVCGAPISGDAVHVPRPRLGRMRLSTGELIDLDQSLIIGRQPSVSRVQGGTMPRLVQVESPGGDISRSHVEVRLEGWHVMLCDLKATNGTVLIREGQAPRRLAQNEMAILLDGDIAELGDDISLRFEEIL